MTLSSFIYHASSGESFDSIALEVYGDEIYAPDIMSANPALCGKVVFDGGEQVFLPEIDLPSSNDEARLNNTLAPWRAS